MPSEDGLRADHRRSSTEPLATPVGRGALTPPFTAPLAKTLSLRSQCEHWLWQSVLLDLCAGVLRMTLLRCPKFLRCLTADAGNFDRGHSLASLHPPPAALGSLPTSARPVISRTPGRAHGPCPTKCVGGPMCPAATGTSASSLTARLPLRRARGKMKKYVIRVRKLLTNGREHGIIILVLARLAQLVEHMLDVHGVTGSSPVPRTIVKSPGISWIPGLFVILPKYAFLDFGQMPPEASKIAFSPGPAKAV